MIHHFHLFVDKTPIYFPNKKLYSNQDYFSKLFQLIYSARNQVNFNCLEIRILTNNPFYQDRLVTMNKSYSNSINKTSFLLYIPLWKMAAVDDLK